MLLEELTGPVTRSPRRTRAEGPGGRDLFLATFLVGPTLAVAAAAASLPQPAVAAPLGLSVVLVWALYLGWLLWSVRRAVAARHGQGEAVASRTLALGITPFVLVGPVLVLALA